MKEKMYKQASKFYLVGNFANKGLVFLTIPIFTRLLKTSDYGIVTTYNSWVIILSMITGCALHMAIRMFYVDEPDKLEEFNASLTSFILLNGAFLLVLLSIVSAIIDLPISYFLIVLCMIQAIATAVINNYSQILMLKFKYKKRTALMILPNLISIVGAIILIYYFMDSKLYYGRIVPKVITYVIFLFILLYIIYSKNKLKTDWSYVKYGLSLSAPLIVHGIALNILSQSDRTMITLFVGASETGIYSLIYNFSMIAMVITTAMEGVWVPWFLNNMKSRNIDEINEVAGIYSKFVCYAIVMIILGGPEIIYILADKDYWSGFSMIPPIVGSNFMIFLYTFYVNIEHFNKKTKMITLNTMIAATANIVLNIIFIPKYGYVAAAYTTLISYLISFLMHYMYARKLEATMFPFKVFGKYILIIILGSVLFYLFLGTFYIRWGIIVMSTLYMLIANKELIKRVL